MGKKPRDFNEAASSWDEDPRRVRLASEVAECLKKVVEVTGEMTVLDYGCGTGLVTLCLQPLVRSITGADLSDGMLEIFRGKIAARGLTNVKAVLLDPDRETFPAESFDLLVSSMTLHHVENVARLLADFFRILRPGGQLAVADLDAEDGNFHGHGLATAHSGFDRDRMRGMLEKAGFREIREVTAATIEKPDARDIIRAYTVFLMTARK
ncbi:MAG: class I SAM-dependent methyltransferase [Deltaproteobacteria bacterium]|nr:class I SAM-dependent methyltransferase [Deltaproteobacteria bacterium]